LDINIKIKKMKKIKVIVICLALLNFLSISIFGQNAATNSGGQVNQTQPSVITVPLKKQGQNYRALIEDPVNGFNVRTALNVVDQALKVRGFVTNDFIGTLEKTQTMNAFADGVQVDEQTAIIDASAADIYITVDANVSKGDKGTEVSLFLVAKSATGLKLSTSIPGNSGKFYIDDVHKLMVKALDNIKEDFLNELQRSFTDMVNNGQQVGLQFSITGDSPINFNSEIGTDGDLLSEAISDWLGKNAFKNYVKPSGGGTAILLKYDIKLPLKNQSTGINYLPKEDFGKLIRKYLRTLKVDSEITSPQPGQLLVTIKGKISN
jgi:hypothetical protein